MKLKPIRGLRNVPFESILAFRPDVNREIVEEANRFGRRLSLTPSGKKTAKTFIDSLTNQRTYAKEDLERLRQNFRRESGLRIDLGKVDAKWVKDHREGLGDQAKKDPRLKDHPQFKVSLGILDIAEQRLKDIREIDKTISLLHRRIKP